MHPRPVTATSRSLILIFLVLVLLAGLPLAVWLDLRNLTERALLRQANDLNSLMTSVRGYYANNVVGRVLASPGSTQVVHNYETIPGAIPIPATLSLELGRTISEQQQNSLCRTFRSRIGRRTSSTILRQARSPRCATIPTKN